MRLFFRAGIVALLGAGLAACNKDSAAPVDFDDPAAVSSNLSSVDSTFNSDVFRSFTVTAFMLDVAAQPSIRPAATLLQTLHPKLERSGAHAFLPGLIQGQKLQMLAPQLSLSAAQGAIIPDSMFGRVFEWDTAGVGQYSWQDSTIAGLTGVRFILYAVGLDGQILEPVTPIGTLDILDASTANALQLHILVRNNAGTTTFVDYTVELTGNSSTVQANAVGSIRNGLAAPNNKELSFDETLTVTSSSIRVTATFALNSPATTLMLNESLSFNTSDLVINTDFRLIQNGHTIRTVGRITVNNLDAVNVVITVYFDGGPVASLSGDPTLAETQWVDAGGEPLSPADLAALDDLFDALSQFDAAVSSLFSPIGTFAGL
jgi:hypothetical protein